MWFSDMPAGGLAPHGLNVLFQIRLGPSGLRAPVSHGVLAVSSRTVMNNAGYGASHSGFMTRIIPSPAITTPLINFSQRPSRS